MQRSAYFLHDKMKNFFVFIVLSLLLSSCSSDEGLEPLDIERPKNLIGEKEMVEILSDVSILEGAYSLRYVQIVRYADVLAKDVEDYLAKRNITSDQYRESIRYYTTQGKEWAAIQQEVKLKLQEKLDQLPPAAVVPTEEAGTISVVGEE